MDVIKKIGYSGAKGGKSMTVHGTQNLACLGAVLGLISVMWGPVALEDGCRWSEGMRFYVSIALASCAALSAILLTVAWMRFRFDAWLERRYGTSIFADQSNYTDRCGIPDHRWIERNFVMPRLVLLERCGVNFQSIQIKAMLVVVDSRLKWEEAKKVAREISAAHCDAEGSEIWLGTGGWRLQVALT